MGCVSEWVAIPHVQSPVPESPAGRGKVGVHVCVCTGEVQHVCGHCVEEDAIVRDHQHDAVGPRGACGQLASQPQHLACSGAWGGWILCGESLRPPAFTTPPPCCPRKLQAPMAGPSTAPYRAN